MIPTAISTSPASITSSATQVQRGRTVWVVSLPARCDSGAMSPPRVGGRLHTSYPPAADLRCGGRSGGTTMSEEATVRELRLVVTTDDYDAAVAFYRDVLGMPASAEYLSEDQGRVVILEAGGATLEIGDVAHGEYVDRVEVGRRVAAGQVRVALRVDDATGLTSAATEAGAEVVAPPTVTPWRSLNARLEGPGGLQLTLYQDSAD